MHCHRNPLVYPVHGKSEFKQARQRIQDRSRIYTQARTRAFPTVYFGPMTMSFAAVISVQIDKGIFVVVVRSTFFGD